MVTSGHRDSTHTPFDRTEISLGAECIAGRRAGRQTRPSAVFLLYQKGRGLPHLSGSRPRDRRFHVERKTKERQYCYYLTVASRLCAGSYLKQNYEMLAERARGLLSGELSRPDEHETRRPAPRFPQPRIDDFTLKRRRGAVCRLYYPRRLFGAGARR